LRFRSRVRSTGSSVLKPSALVACGPAVLIHRAPELKRLLVRYRSMASTASPKSTEAAVKQTAKSVEQQTRKVADTARELKHSSARIEDSADRTTVLAADRNILASERTYAAWVRTGLLALAGGIAARALKDVPNWLVLANGTLLITFSLFCFGAAVWRHFHPGPPPPSPSVKVMPWPALVVANAVLSMIALGALIVLWSMPPSS
jgi:putative membrane protein